MSSWLERVLTIFCAVMASGGFWAWLQSRNSRKDAKTKMILGLGHDRIVNLCMQYISRGWITHDEYENLETYLFKPYKELKGNGTAERLMIEVKKLPVRSLSFIQQAQAAQRLSVSDPDQAQP